MKAEQIFKQYPKIDSFFETSDGSQFFTDNEASAHARNLEDRKVTEVKRPSKKEVTAAKEADTKDEKQPAKPADKKE